jgi:transposase
MVWPAFRILQHPHGPTLRDPPGKKRHILVDTLGLLLHAMVHPADIQDRDGGILLLATLFGMYPFLKKLFADGAYQGPQFQKPLAKILPYLQTEIVKRSDQTTGFVVLPRRWIVGRTIAWLNRCRRLAKDWENLNRYAPLSCASPQSASCSENFAIPRDVSGQTLSPFSLSPWLQRSAT